MANSGLSTNILPSKLRNSVTGSQLLIFHTRFFFDFQHYWDFPQIHWDFQTYFFVNNYVFHATSNFECWTNVGSEFNSMQKDVQVILEKEISTKGNHFSNLNRDSSAFQRKTEAFHKLEKRKEMRKVAAGSPSRWESKAFFSWRKKIEEGVLFINYAKNMRILKAADLFKMP